MSDRAEAEAETEAATKSDSETEAGTVHVAAAAGPTAGGGAMNDPEVTMSEALPTRRGGLEAEAYATRAAAIVLALVSQVPSRLGFLTDQLTRAACSAALNVAEGNGRAGRDRLYHWRIAYGSTREARVALEQLCGSGTVDDAKASEAGRLLDSVGAMTWRLLHPRR